MSAPLNPPAFPHDDGDDVRPGMSLRDYFAAQALVGILSNPKNDDAELTMPVDEWAYTIADHMLETRLKGDMR